MAWQKVDNYWITGRSPYSSLRFTVQATNFSSVYVRYTMTLITQLFSRQSIKALAKCKVIFMFTPLSSLVQMELVKLAVITVKLRCLCQFFKFWSFSDKASTGIINWHTGIEMRSNAESYEAVGQEAGFVMESVEKVSLPPRKTFYWHKKWTEVSVRV